jgi:hypothetical protein
VLCLLCVLDWALRPMQALRTCAAVESTAALAARAAGERCKRTQLLNAPWRCTLRRCAQVPALPAPARRRQQLRAPLGSASPSRQQGADPLGSIARRARTPSARGSAPACTPCTRPARVRRPPPALRRPTPQEQSAGRPCALLAPPCQAGGQAPGWAPGQASPPDLLSDDYVSAALPSPARAPTHPTSDPFHASHLMICGQRVMGGGKRQPAAVYH